jgi:S-methylmethionine-dependent homocysteine/selenocysteine methylase
LHLISPVIYLSKVKIKLNRNLHKIFLSNDHNFIYDTTTQATMQFFQRTSGEQAKSKQLQSKNLGLADALKSRCELGLMTLRFPVLATSILIFRRPS